MAWYTVPKVKIRYLYDEDGKITGVYLTVKDFEKLAEKMEDFYDIADVEHIKKTNKKFYTLEEINARIFSDAARKKIAQGKNKKAL